MRTLLYATVATTLVALTVPAAPQALDLNNMLQSPGKIKTQDQVDEENQRNSDYQNSMKKLPDQNAKRDPWGTMRAGGTAQTGQKPDQKATQKTSQKTDSKKTSAPAQ